MEIMTPPKLAISEEDGPAEIVFRSISAESQSVKLKLRNNSTRLMLYRVRFGDDVQKTMIVAPTDIGILSPYDTQPFEVTAKIGAKPTLRSFLVEVVFLGEKREKDATVQGPMKPMLDAAELWKATANQGTTTKSIPIRFDDKANPDESTVYVSATDPNESKWTMDWHVFEVYGFARTQHPREFAGLLWFLFWFAVFWFVAGFLAGLKFG